ncbi:MAG: endonuclease/exonuclease/phosphatase family protein, partial [Leptospiraceae bacterium]|nr:endonuclease/exonuclease/phosphatase family protein [Leptospiraceae bacterium]
MSIRPREVLIIVTLIVSAATLALVWTAAEPQQHTDDGALRVMTFNVHQGFDNSGRTNPVPFLKAIEAYRPDLVSLQESESNRLLSSQYDLVLWLARRTGMHYYYGPGTGENIYGVSILSAYPLHNQRVYHLPAEEDPRVAVQGELDVNGTPVRFLAVHLGLSVPDRYHQMKYIFNEQIKKHTGPLIIAGDFNTLESENFISEQKPDTRNDGWDENRLREFADRQAQNTERNIAELAAEEQFFGMRTYRRFMTDSWRMLNPDDHDAYSWLDTNVYLGKPQDELESSVRIDYVFVSDHFSVESARIVADENALAGSDHLPVIVDLKL